MYPELPNVQKYSYTSFSNKDLFINRYRYNYHLDECDTIDFTNKSPEDTENWLRNNFLRYEKDIYSDTSHYKFYFLKNFIFKERFHEMSVNQIDYQYHLFDYIDKESNFIWEFDISNWDEYYKAKNIDSRTVRITLYRENKESVILSYLVKLDHIYQCILDLDKIVDSLKESKLSANDVNYKVLPIFMVYSPGKLSGPCNHIRISRLIDNRKISGEFKGRILYYLLHGLVRFAVLNYKMLIATENTTKSKPKKKSTSKKNNNTSESTGRRIIVEIDVPVDREPVENIVSINLDDDIKVNINTSRNNVYYSRKDDILVNVIKYRTQVRGYWNHYWCGKGENKHLEARWIEPYIRNKSSRNISKKVYKGDNTYESEDNC